MRSGAEFGRHRGRTNNKKRQKSTTADYLIRVTTIAKIEGKMRVRQELWERSR